MFSERSPEGVQPWCTGPCPLQSSLHPSSPPSPLGTRCSGCAPGPVLIEVHGLQDLPRHGAIFGVKDTVCSDLRQELRQLLIHTFDLPFVLSFLPTPDPEILAPMALFVGAMPCSCHRATKVLISKYGSNVSRLMLFHYAR